MGGGRRTLIVLGVVALGLLASTNAWAQSPTTPAPAVQFPPFDPAACVAKPQHLLILDMKSGWWSNDGGNLHHLLLERVVKDCPNIDIEYHFIQDLGELGNAIPGFLERISGFTSFYPQKPGINNDAIFLERNFPARPWNEFSQIWVLSGSNLDGSDIKTDDEFFLALLSKLTTLTTGAPATAPAQPPASFFIGGGLGNHDHANKLLAAFQMPELFQSHDPDPDTPGVGDGSTIKSLTRARVGVELSAHAAFEGVESIVDTLSIDDRPHESDFFPVANNPFTMIGTNGKGEPAIGVRETETRRFVIDGGMQRFYSLFKPEETATYRYLQNLIKWLAR
jgi:hypothetical protein